MTRPNGFVLFTRQRQQDLIRKGNPVGSLKEAISLFGKEWAVMSAEERKPYEDKAMKLRRGQEKAPNDGHLGNGDESAASEAQKISSSMSTLLHERNPANVFFVVMNCNYFCRSSSSLNTFVPAEIGMCAFSIKSGVIDNYWTLVDPQSLPIGKLLEGKENQELHQIPLPPFEPRFQDLRRILLNISEFLKRYKPLSRDWTDIFCLPSETGIVEGSLNWLIQSIDSPEIEIKFKMQPLPYLLYKLNAISLEDPLERARRSWISKLANCMDLDEAKQLDFSNVGQCSSFFDTTRRAFEPGLSCPYHEKAAPFAMQHCSLSRANRYAMNMLEVLAPRFRITAKPGFHVQLDNTEEQGMKRNEFLVKWGYLPEFLKCEDPDHDFDETAKGPSTTCYLLENSQTASNRSVSVPDSTREHRTAFKTTGAQETQAFNFGDIFGYQV